MEVRAGEGEGDAVNELTKIVRWACSECHIRGRAISPYDFVDDSEALAFAKYDHNKQSPHCSKLQPFSYAMEREKETL